MLKAPKFWYQNKISILAILPQLQQWQSAQQQEAQDEA